MYKLLTIMAFIITATTAQALDHDNISVTINGRTYQCGGQGSSDIIYYCRCDSTSNVSAALNYIRFDRQNGNEKILRTIMGGSIEECRSELKNNPICTP